MTARRLLTSVPKVINIGVGDFAEAVAEQGAEIVDVDWKPPRVVDRDIRALLEKLL